MTADRDQDYGGIALLNKYLNPWGPATAPPTGGSSIGFTGRWIFEGADEVKLLGTVTGSASGTADQIGSVTIVVPAGGSAPRTVTDFICPTQLPVGVITTTTTPGDFDQCAAAASRRLNQQFQLNIRTSPVPMSGWEATCRSSSGTASARAPSRSADRNAAQRVGRRSRTWSRPVLAPHSGIKCAGIWSGDQVKQANWRVVEQQLEYGRTTIARRFTPPPTALQDRADVPADAKAAIYRLTSVVAANAQATAHGFSTFSLPLPVKIG